MSSEYKKWCGHCDKQIKNYCKCNNGNKNIITINSNQEEIINVNSKQTCNFKQINNSKQEISTIKGERGLTGSMGLQGPPGNSIIIFATSEPVYNGHFIGYGSSSHILLKNTILIPFNCIIKSLSFSIRVLSESIPYMVTLFINGIPSSLNATINDGSQEISTTKTTNLKLNSLDLISLQITFSSNDNLVNGICTTLVIN
jgi:hypothetical protein